MIGRTPAEAVNRFLTLHQSALSCVTNSVIQVAGGYFPRSEPHTAELSENPSPLGSRRSNLRLFVAIRYIIVQGEQARNLWAVQIVGYNFSLQDASYREILAYHWHPLGVSAVTTPHLHLGPGALVGRDDLKGAHLPTGVVALADVVRLAVTDLGVIPRRNDWAEALS